MSLSYECRQLIDSRDVDETGFCKASALLGHMQEAATQAAEGSAFGRDALLHSRNAFWMLTRIFFRLRRPLGWEEEITLRTWHRGGRGAVLYRDFDLLAEDGPVGEVVSAWVLADVDSRRLLRLADIPELQGTEGENCKTRKLTKLRRPAELVLAESRPMHYSDTDINGHVNNTRYADFACDAVGMPRPGQFLSELRLGYLAECRIGEVLEISAGGAPDRPFVLGCDAEGKARFEAELVFRALPLD